LPRKQRSGLTRLGRYLRGRRARVAVLAVIAMAGAAGPVIGLLLVQDAIDKYKLEGARPGR